MISSVCQAGFHRACLWIRRREDLRISDCSVRFSFRITRGKCHPNLLCGDYTYLGNVSHIHTWKSSSEILRVEVVMWKKLTLAHQRFIRIDRGVSLQSVLGSVDMNRPLTYKKQTSVVDISHNCLATSIRSLQPVSSFWNFEKEG